MIPSRGPRRTWGTRRHERVKHTRLVGAHGGWFLVIARSALAALTFAGSDATRPGAGVHVLDRFIAVELSEDDS